MYWFLIIIHANLIYIVNFIFCFSVKKNFSILKCCKMTHH